MQNVGGMKNFFGSKLGGHVFNALSHLSPVNIGSGAARARINQVYASSGMMGAGKAAFQEIKAGMAQAKGRNYSFGDWFTGKTLSRVGDVSGEGLGQTRAAWRIGVGATAGVAAISSVVAPGNPLDITARSAIQLGGHTAVAGAIGSVSPWGGAAYAGVAALNAVRSGDNFGPF